MKTITVNYRNHEPKTFQYDIKDDIEVNVKFKDSQGYCKGTANEEKFYMSWAEWANGDKFLEDWTNDRNGAPKKIKYSAHVIEALLRTFTK